MEKFTYIRHHIKIVQIVSFQEATQLQPTQNSLLRFFPSCQIYILIMRIISAFLSRAQQLPTISSQTTVGPNYLNKFGTILDEKTSNLQNYDD